MASTRFNSGRNIRASSKRESGQILVLMALLSTTLVILFGMVVGVGHLIQARMNLQNAVDLAAMAGASWQARYMNHLSMVNYRLRQNYKFQLYDFYVTSSRFNRGLLAQVQGPTGVFDRVPKDQTAFGICQQSFGFDPNFALDGIQSTGAPLAADTDYCQNVQGRGGIGLTIPPIRPSPVPNLNPILIAANFAVQGLSDRLRQLCGEASNQNQIYFNIMTRALDKRQRFQVGQMINIIDQFDRAFSTGPLLAGGRTGDDTIRRTLLDNLTGANKTGNMEIRWLTPNDSRAFRVGNINDLETRVFLRASPGQDFEKYFQRQRTQFTFPYIFFGPTCSAQVRQAQALGDPTIVGIARTRVNNGSAENPVRVPIFTALQVTLTPNILFWPRGLTPTLVAVGAAKPFGSRIGPPLELTNLEITGERNLVEESQTRIAQGNMSFYPGDIDDSGPNGGLAGIGHRTILQYLFRALDPPGNGLNSGVRTRRPSIDNNATSGSCAGTGPLPFNCLALAPTLYEGLFWNAYQFPPETMTNPLARASFPFEVPILPAADNPYLLPDRMQARVHTPAELQRWHFTTFIGRTAQFRINDRPVFFADTVSALSSWSPDHEYDAGSVRPGIGASGQTQSEGRQGYAIKLVSLAEVCKEMQRGGAVAIEDPIRKFCLASSPDRVFH